MSRNSPISSPLTFIQRWALRKLDRLAVRLGPAGTRPPHLLLGERGEREAIFALRRLGYVIVAARWQSSRMRGDVDLIAWSQDVLCFIEVKTRTALNPQDPAESAVDRDKQRQLRRLAPAYLRRFPEAQRDRVPVRFDVVAVYFATGIPEVQLFSGAFPLRDQHRSPQAFRGV